MPCELCGARRIPCHFLSRDGAKSKEPSLASGSSHVKIAAHGTDRRRWPLRDARRRGGGHRALRLPVLAHPARRIASTSRCSTPQWQVLRRLRRAARRPRRSSSSASTRRACRRSPSRRDSGTSRSGARWRGSPPRSRAPSASSSRCPNDRSTRSSRRARPGAVRWDSRPRWRMDRSSPCSASTRARAARATSTRRSSRYSGSRGSGINLRGTRRRRGRAALLALVPTEDGGFPTLEGRLCRALRRACDDGLIDYSLGAPFTYVPLKNVLAMSDDATHAAALPRPHRADRRGAAPMPIASTFR